MAIFICPDCPNRHNSAPKRLKCLSASSGPGSGPKCEHEWTAKLTPVTYDDGRKDIQHLPDKCPKCGSLWYLLLNQEDFKLRD